MTTLLLSSILKIVNSNTYNQKPKQAKLRNLYMSSVFWKFFIIWSYLKII